MLPNKSHYNIKFNNYYESFNNFESPTKSLDIMSQRTFGCSTQATKSKGLLNNISPVSCHN